MRSEQEIRDKLKQYQDDKQFYFDNPGIAFLPEKLINDIDRLKWVLGEDK